MGEATLGCDKWRENTCAVSETCVRLVCDLCVACLLGSRGAAVDESGGDAKCAHRGTRLCNLLRQLTARTQIKRERSAGGLGGGEQACVCCAPAGDAIEERECAREGLAAASGRKADHVATRRTRRPARRLHCRRPLEACSTHGRSNERRQLCLLWRLVGRWECRRVDPRRCSALTSAARRPLPCASLPPRTLHGTDPISYQEFLYKYMYVKRVPLL